MPRGDGGGLVGRVWDAVTGRSSAPSRVEPPPRRVDLAVPFEAKDEAKRRGARWDPAARTWYAPPGADLALLREWLPPEQPAGPRCRVRVVALPEECWRCGETTRAIVGVIVDGQDLPGGAGTAAGFVHFADVAPVLAAALSPGALRHVGAGPLRRRHSRTAGAAYLSNGCRACDALQGDVPLRSHLATHLEVGGDLAALVVGRVSIPSASIPVEWLPVVELAGSDLPPLTDDPDDAGMTVRALTMAELERMVDGEELPEAAATPDDVGAVLIPVEGPIRVRQERLTHAFLDEFIGGYADAIYIVHPVTGRQAAAAYVHDSGYRLGLPRNPRASALLCGRSNYVEVVGPVLLTGMPGDFEGENSCPGWLVQLALQLDADEGRSRPAP